MWPAIDVIAEKNLGWLCNRRALKINIDAREKCGKEISAPMNVADDVYALASGDARPSPLLQQLWYLPRQKHDPV